MYEVGISTFQSETDESFFKSLAGNGIYNIEISRSDYDGFDFIKTKKLADEHNINIWSLHLPFMPFEKLDLSSADKNIRNRTVNDLRKIIKKASDIGIDKFVVHPSGEPISDSERPERLKYAKESLSYLADTAEQSGAVICAEDLPRTCIGHSVEEMKFLTSDDVRLKICFDTNHITVQNPEDAILALSDKIVTLHVSDFDFEDERHMLPGEGKINWNAVLSSLKKINYSGIWLYEVVKSPKTIVRSRDLTPADFKRNAVQIFAGKALDII